jgi:hypothetical protein
MAGDMNTTTGCNNNNEGLLHSHRQAESDRVRTAFGFALSPFNVLYIKGCSMRAAVSWGISYVFAVHPTVRNRSRQHSIETF